MSLLIAALVLSAALLHATWNAIIRNGADRLWGLPRTVNFITGPSRTGDIEQRIELGAHGPRRLHIVLIEDGGTSP